MRARSVIATLGATLGVTLSGCHSAPSRNVLGSYFPSWMLCALIGIVLSAILHVVLARTGVDQFVPKKILVYPSLALSMTFFSWLVWFGN